MQPTSRTDKYQKKGEIDHVLTRPDMYVGSIQSKKSEEYIAIPTSDGYKIQNKEMKVSPAFVRIFVEVLSNAVDNVQESKTAGVPCTKIKVNINKETGETSVFNDGLSIPIEKKDGDYIHTTIFGQFRTSGNYDDDKERIVSGRNGYGVKLTNIFSTYFRIRGIDPETKSKISQEWTNNMKTVDSPVIQPSKLSGCTEISFIPDFKKFGMKGYTDDILHLFYKYTIDVAMNTGVNVYLNGELLPYSNMIEYARLYIEDEDTKEILHLKDNNTEIVLTPCNTYSVISFVNGVYTMKGGKHVDSWSEEIFRPLVKKFNKKNKPQVNIKDIKQFFMLFVKSTVINPVFESQSKHLLEGPDVTASVPAKFINTIMKWSVASKIQDIIESKELVALKKTEVKTRGYIPIDGYDRANNSSNSKLANQCILIIVEGKSAKQYAVWGIDVGVYGKIGRDWFGIMFVRGKILNVRNSSASVIADNKVISNLTNALGLRYNVDYTDDKNFNTLRYGKLMLITDADVDGIHISGLAINYIRKLFPSLMNREEPFIIEMCTPVAKIKKTTFYDERDYNEYHELHGDSFSKKDYKYYKGLGSSTSLEVKNTFGQKIIEYTSDSCMDDTLNKVFLSKASDDRKTWLSEYNPQAYKALNNKDKISKMNVTDFYDNYMIQFSLADCARSIPNLMDGLKESQRKILYACFKRNLKSELKVGRLGGYVAENTNYHHGETSLESTITHMASCFVGGNNIPLLTRNGMFGSRLMGGKDAAAARYICTHLETVSRCLFPEDDDVLLKRVIDDGDVVEPVFYPCIIPLILANPCNGAIGTGWSSTIPAHNPLDLCSCVEAWINNDCNMFDENGETCFPQISPWYRGFTGIIEPDTDKKKTRYVSKGTYTRNDKGTVIVTELPIGMWTEDFQTSLEESMKNKMISCIKNYSTPTTVHYEITESVDGFTCNHDTLKLTTYLHYTNLVAFTEEGKLKKFNNIYEIIDAHCKVRFEYYIKRKSSLLLSCKSQLNILNNKKRFIQDIINDTLKIFREEDDVVQQRIEEHKFDKENDSYDYLLSIQTRSYTKKKIDELEKEINKYLDKIKKLENTSEKQLWLNDIALFRKQYEKFLIDIEKEVIKPNPKAKSNKKK
jgi:DNA topoisomerase-2